MSKDEILLTVKSLGMSQGFYGRLYLELVENDDLLLELERQNFKDSVDLILYLEQ